METGNSVVPPIMTAGELQQKLARLADMLRRKSKTGIVLTAEGALRWLTGLKHQLVDIAPSADAPVQILIQLEGADAFKATVASKPFETPRLRDEIPRVFAMHPALTWDIVDALPPLSDAILCPGADGYSALVDEVVRPLLDGLNGNPYRKLAWLAKTAMTSLEATARGLEAGMDGLAVRGRLLGQLAARGVDANLVLVALAGQASHLHPIAASHYRVERDTWLKLVVGARYAEHIVSQSLMVKLGGAISTQEAAVYGALQQAAVEYADLYREDATEEHIYTEMIRRFQQVERDTGLAGFGPAATLHHPGGGTSPLGNRDRMIDPHGQRGCDAWTQFAINPVEPLLNFKVELQGIIQPGGAPPMILDMRTPESGLSFTKVVASGGTVAELPDLLVV